MTQSPSKLRTATPSTTMLPLENLLLTAEIAHFAIRWFTSVLQLLHLDLTVRMVVCDVIIVQ